jgi:DNA-binding CsgD family transcriptional regulator/tetratricopeptide (TPR) repeat protein
LRQRGSGDGMTLDDMISRTMTSPVLVGRREELARLRGLLGRAAAGSPVVALVAGEAGVGKTRLVQELTGIAAEQGVRVLHGGCVDLGGEGVPLAPLVDVLRALARATPADELDMLLGPARREFARLLPELDPTVRAGVSPGVAAAALLEHVLGLITRLAAQRPLLLVVEDLHWADRSTRDLMAFLAQTLRELGVLLLLTYRSDELHRRHPLRPLVAGWERLRTVERFELHRFSRAEVAAQLRAIRDTPPTTQFIDVVFERSQGNAFLVEEILAAVDRGADPGDLPPSLRDVLLTRTETLSEAAQQVLRTAAAAGHWVEDRLLAVVAGMPAVELYPALREAVEHHLLVVDESSHGYAFRHALTRDAMYDDMLPGERVRLHAAYGEALSANPQLLSDDGTVAAALAHHWYAALDLPRALTAAVGAGRQAAAAYAPAEALRHLERALQIWPRVPDAAERAGMDWSELNMLAAEAAWSTGALSRALSIMDQALTDPDSAADPVRRAGLVERRAHVLRSLGRDEEAARQLREALDLLPAQPVTKVHALVLASLANSVIHLGDDEVGRDIARRAIDVAATVKAPAQQADALNTFGSVSAYLGDAQTGLAALREGLELAERHDLPAVALRCYLNLSDVLEMLGRRAEASEVARAGVALAVRYGYARSQGAMLVSNLAEPLMRLGRWQEAMDLITEALADEPSGLFASSLLLMRGELLAWQGDPVAATRDVREARRQFGDGSDMQYTAPMAFVEAEVARAGGQLATAQQVIQAALAGPITALSVRYAWPLVWLGTRVEADLATGPGQPGAALRALAATIPATTPPARAYQALTAAEVARLEHRDEVAAWRAAVAAAGAAEEAYPLCYSLFRLAEAQCAHGETAGATVTARECLRRADDLAARVATDARALARRARLRVEPAVPVTAPQVPEPRVRLTDREREVLGLVVEGRSNGQIATTLYISPKTASVHVSNILAKLGAASRTQAATLAHRHGLLSIPD